MKLDDLRELVKEYDDIEDGDTEIHFAVWNGEEHVSLEIKETEDNEDILTFYFEYADKAEAVTN